MAEEDNSILTDSILEQIRERFEEELTEDTDEVSLHIPISLTFSFNISDDEDAGADDFNDMPNEPSAADNAALSEEGIEVNEAQQGKTDPMQELASLIGLQNVKDQVRSLANLIHVRQLRQSRGMPLTDTTQHMIFTGNPGTGKTTVARILAQIYAQFGFLSKGHLTEVDRSELIGGYVGQTAIKVKKVVDRATGGVLFIDEAYSLVREGDQQDYGQEAVSTLLKLMEDRRDDLVVIAAGYPDLMETFLDSNPGLASRFSHRIAFPDYNAEELMQIFKLLCKGSFAPTPKALDAVRGRYDRILADTPKNFGNGRDVRNLFEQAMVEQANRIVLLKRVNKKVLETISEADVKAADADLQRTIGY